MTNWYYFDATGKKCGPVDSGTLKVLAQHGVITPSTTIINDAGKGAVAGKVKGLEFPQPLTPVNSSKPVVTPPDPPIMQVPVPVVVNSISPSLKDTFNQLTDNVLPVSNFSTAYNASAQNSRDIDALNVYYLDKKREEENKKRIQKTNQSSTSVVSLMLLVIFGVIGFFAFYDYYKQNEQKVQEAKQVEDDKRRREMQEMQEMRDSYNKIRMGMSYKEVVDIVGHPTSKLSETEFGGHHAAIYMWQVGSSGANFNITFQNDKAVTKAQFGL